MRGGARALTVLLMSSLPLLALLLLFYFVYTHSRQEFLVQRDYRVLSAIEREITSSLDAECDALSTIGRTLANPKGAAVNEVVDSTIGRTPADPKGSAFNEVVQNLVALGSAGFEPKGSEGLKMPAGKVEACRAGLEALGGSYFMRLSYQSVCDDDSARYSDKDCKKAVNQCTTEYRNGPPSLCFEAPIASLVKGPIVAVNGFGKAALPDTRGAFDIVLVALSDGAVVYQSDQSLGAVRNLSDLIILEPQAQTNAQSAEASETPAAAKKEAPVAGGSPSPAPATFRPTLREYQTVRLLNNDYLAFNLPGVQRVEVEETKGPGLVIVGLLRKDRLAADERRLPSPVLVTVVSVLILALFLWPFLRLWYAAPNERLDGADVRLLVASYLMAFSIAMFLWCDFGTYLGLAHEQDAQLKTIAEEALHRLQTELQAGYEALDDLESTPARHATPIVKQLLIINQQGKVDQAFRPHFEPDHGTLEGTWTYLGFRPQSRLDQRGYFTAIKSGSLWDCKGPAHKCAVEVIRSKLDSSYTLVVARAPQGSRGTEHGIFAAGMDPRPFVEPVLPVGSGFAFIRGNGEVQIHSVTDRDLAENFFRECEDDLSLRSVVWAGVETYVSVSYHGEDHRLYIRPVPGSPPDDPWTLIAFQHLSVPRAFNSQLTVRFLTSQLAYFVIGVLFLIALQLGAASYRATWIWPVRARGPTRYVNLYVGATALLALSAIAIALVLDELRGWRTVAVAVVFSSIVTSGLMFSLERWKRLGSTERALGLLVGASGNAIALAAIATAMGSGRMILAPLLLTIMWALFALYRNRSGRWPDADVEVSPPPEGWSEVRFRAAYCSMIFFLGLCVAGAPALSFALHATRHELAALVHFEKRLWNASVRNGASRNDRATTAIAENTIKKPGIALKPEDAITVVGPLKKELKDHWSNYYPNNWITYPRKRIAVGSDGYTDEPPVGSSSEPWPTDVSPWIPSSGFYAAAQEEAAELQQISHGLSRVSGVAAVKTLPIPFPLRVEIVIALAIALGFYSMLWTMVRLIFLLDEDKPPLRVDNSADSPSSRWSQLNTPSRMALAQLIQENFLNPNAQGIRSLFQKGLLVRDPAVSVPRELESHIAAEVSAEDLEAWERSELKAGWVNLRSAALIFLFMVAGFLFITQPTLLTSSAAVIAGLTAIVPPILRAFSLLGESKDSGK
jgi:hypothetical protein